MEKNHLAHQQAMCQLLEEFDRVCKALDIPYVLFAGTMLGAVRHQGFIPWDDDLDVALLRKDYDRLLKEADKVLDSEKFYLQKEYSEHWPMFFSKLRLNNTTCLEKYHPKDHQTHQGVFIDIFPCDNCAKTGFGRRLQFLASKVVIAKSLYKRGYETHSKKKKAFIQFCRLLPNKLFLAVSKWGREDSALVHSFLGGASSFKKSVYPRKCFREQIDATFEGKQYPIPVGYDRLLHIMYRNYHQLPPEEDRLCKQHAILVDLENSYEQYVHYRDDMEFEIHTRSIR
jgi:lipopolysaccharide cholinephosphotransferase